MPNLGVSNGVALQLPLISPQWIDVRHIFSLDPASATGSGPFPGGVVVEFR
ncbi:MAG: hypothetical protein AAF628_34130 [Planctomycetota bacterium]